MSYQRRNLVLSIVAVVCLVAALVVFLRTRGRGGNVFADEYMSPCVCLACQLECEIHHGPQDLVPFKCPNPDCGQVAAYPWYFCYDCKKRFVPQPLMREPGGPLRPPENIRCTACGSGNVTQWGPWIEEQPVGDAPLPKWSP